jgi:hypothetical protein
MHRTIRGVRLAAAAVGVFLFFACATPPQFDYTAFRQSRPRSILVMPPINRSFDTGAVATFLATSTIPLAEAGYYVIPVTLSDQTFKQNGVTVADEAHAIQPEKLREIFGADAALYITITRYGTTYQVINSAVGATASARLVDLRTGQELWSGRATAEENSNSNNNNLLVMLLDAVVTQIVNTVSDKAYDLGRQANYKLLSAGHDGSILYGPYHSKYQTD